MSRACRAAVLVAVCLSCLLSAPVSAQVPLPLDEQVRQFNNLPAAQQQALIRELQRQLPPAQREAVIDRLLQGQSQGAAAEGDAQEIPELTPLAPVLDLEEFFPRFGAGDTVPASAQAVHVLPWVIHWRPRSS